MTDSPKAPGFWQTVLLLLGAASKRASGRRERQRTLIQERSGGRGTDWSALGFAFTILAMCALHVLAAFVISVAVEAGQKAEAAREGKIVVSEAFRNAVKNTGMEYSDSGKLRNFTLEKQYAWESEELAKRYGISSEAAEDLLREEVHKHGIENLVTRSEAAPGLSMLAKTGPIPQLFGSLLLILWGVMLVFQGEGLEMDLQRRRHPMWEWIFSHPVKPGAVFFAEMLTPIAANPVYWTAPLFAGVLYGIVYDLGTGFLAAALVGIPVALTAACVGKALEIAVILRFPPRTRGAVVGIMSWLGYATMMLFFFGLYFVPKLGTAYGAIGKAADIFAVVPWPWLRLFVGEEADGSLSFPLGVVTCWSVAAVTTTGAVWFSVWGAKRGLSGNVSAADLQPSRANGKSRFSKNAVYRKELLWFLRDRSAIVQAILVPLTVATFQLFNFRWILSHAQDNWNYLCGAAILFGTYFLWILGPKSLTSEGTALWIALTWPTGLESLLKAKAWLWSMLSSALVALILVYAIFLFPTNSWKIALVFLGWFFFSRSMAEKSVTLVTVTSSSGEQEKIPATRRWAAQLGMLTFAIGVLTQQWPLAAVGIVYSYITAAAMWQNLRARLPFLYDPWSERLPSPPTLMHAMISISILVEIGAVITGSIVGIAGRENIAIAQAVGYGISAIGVSVGVWHFLEGRAVYLADVVRWPDTQIQENGSWWRIDGRNKKKLMLLLALAGACGIVLGVSAVGYTAVLQYIPSIAETIRKSREEIEKIPYFMPAYRVMAIGFAPFAEEYLFRGLLYRALDREWGGWPAILGSAAFFAIYHPPLSWLPVGMLGVVNAVMFKKTGNLAPAVALHMVYNAVVLA